MPQQNKTDWESRFDIEFPNVALPEDRLIYVSKELKDFIRNLLKEQREEVIEKIKAIPETFPEIESDMFDSGLQTMKANILKII